MSDQDTTPAPTPPPPSVVKVVDENGEPHWAAYGSATHQRMTEQAEQADSVVQPAEEVTDAAAEASASGGDLNAGATENGSSDPEPATGDTGDSADQGIPRTKSRR